MPRENRLDLPTECPVTITHFNIHVANAKGEWGQDPEQCCHELDIALRILVVLYRRQCELPIPAWD